jgi:transposase
MQQPGCGGMVENLCLDAGYTGKGDIVVAWGYVPHISPRNKEAAEIKRNPEFKARRWVAEANHSWTNRFRKIDKRHEKTDLSYCALLYLGAVLPDSLQTTLPAEGRIGPFEQKIQILRKSAELIDDPQAGVAEKDRVGEQARPREAGQHKRVRLGFAVRRCQYKEPRLQAQDFAGLHRPMHQQGTGARAGVREEIRDDGRVKEPARRPSRKTLSVSVCVRADTLLFS